MTPEAFKEEMLRIRKTSYDKLGDFDEEACHTAMDNLMCDLLSDLGYEEGVYIFDSTPKYYS